MRFVGIPGRIRPTSTSSKKTLPRRPGVLPLTPSWICSLFQFIIETVILEPAHDHLPLMVNRSSDEPSPSKTWGGWRERLGVVNPEERAVPGTPRITSFVFAGCSRSGSRNSRTEFSGVSLSWSCRVPHAESAPRHCRWREPIGSLRNLQD